MSRIILTWHSMHDQNVCPICQELDGYQWIYEVGKDHFEGRLTHPVYGVVWDSDQGSQAHGHDPSTCRCEITFECDLSDLRLQAQNLLDKLKVKAVASE